MTEMTSSFPAFNMCRDICAIIKINKQKMFFPRQGKPRIRRPSFGPLQWNSASGEKKHHV